MSNDTQIPNMEDSISVDSSTEAVDASRNQFNESEITPLKNNSSDLFTNDSNVLNTTVIEDALENEYLLFEKFVIIEIVMTTLELIISVWATTKMPRWRRNYRNQMLMQLTLARFLKRIIFVFKFLEKYNKITSSDYTSYVLNGCQLYIDFVIVILVFFFIKHMYSSLIIVLVKISQNNFYKVLFCSWLMPVPISALFTVLIVTDVMDSWLVYLLVCSIFRWPLIFVGTSMYITILFRILTDKIRQFASSLAVVTFFLCLIINIYLFSKDIIELWCFKSYTTELMSYISGFLLNLLILCLYAVLIILSSNNKTQLSRCDIPDYSIAEAKC